MKEFILGLIAVTVSCCNSNTSNYDESQKNDGVDTTKNEILKENSLTRSHNISDTGYFLIYKNDSLMQTMRVNYLNKQKINFTLTTIDSFNNKKSVISGIAEMDEKRGDPEEDEADDGVAFLYDNWHYINGKCQLYLRIADSAKYIRIFEFYCNKLHDPSCPFETKGVLKRSDIK